MADNEISVDELVDEINALLQEQPEETSQAEQDQEPAAPSKLRNFGRGLAKVAITLLTTVLLLVVTLYGVMYVLAKGPSTTLRAAGAVKISRLSQ